MKRVRKLLISDKSRRGGILILAASMMIVFLCLAALSIDIGHVFVVRNQLQNAADAAALRGAGYLYPATAAGAPNWTLAQSAALVGVTQNKVDGIALANATITAGYWDITGVSTVLKATNITPGVNDVTAVKVTVSKSAGNNGGPVQLFFGNVLGISTVNLSAKAVAAAGSPSVVGANKLFPIAMAKATYDTYWDAVNNTPKLDPATNQPYIFLISEGVQGGWTTFDNNSNGTQEIINLILNGNPTPLAIGNLIWMVSGAKTAIYSSVPINKDVLVPISTATTPGSQQTIVGFGVVHIISSTGGSTKNVQLYLTSNLEFANGTPGGPRYGVYMPPRLVQ